MPDQIYGVTWNGAEKVSYTYDPLGRLTNRKIGSFSNAHTFEDVGEDKTTTLVQSVVTPAGTYSYTYDNIGNILSIADGTYTSSYEYDSLNQLVRANDERAGKTYTYSYSNGNITEKKEYAYTTGELGEVLDTKTWSYGDTVWSDLLTDFNGTAITYDEVGNPLTIGSKELSWLGRQLTQITDGEEEISYAYNGDGQRVSKTVNGTTTQFAYLGGRLMAQKTGEDVIFFQYGAGGVPLGFVYNSVQYFYITNQLGDIIGITDATGDAFVMYSYDEWGNPIQTITRDNTAEQNKIAEINPLRYRGYYYDTETGYYYLQSRYYNPEWGRFISPDNFSYIDNSTRLGFNAYIYCTNNPVMFIDHSGAKETYNITPQGLVVAIAINETFMIWDLLVIKDELNLNIDLNVSSLWDYAFLKQHVYKTAFDSGKYDNNYSNNMNINAKAGEFLSVFTDILTEFFGGIASVIFSVFEFGADLLIDFSGRFFNGVGTAIMALYDTVSTTLNVLISNVISSFATPFAGIATGVGLSIVDELFTRDLVEVFAYSWHFIFNSLFSWWYDG